MKVNDHWTDRRMGIGDSDLDRQRRRLASHAPGSDSQLINFVSQILFHKIQLRVRVLIIPFPCTDRLPAELGRAIHLPPYADSQADRGAWFPTGVNDRLQQETLESCRVFTGRFRGKSLESIKQLRPASLETHDGFEIIQRGI